MSTSRSRLTRSIQEIAKRDPDLRRAIEATKPRGDQPSAAGVGTSDAERDRICCDGSVSDGANPGTEERNNSEGGQDASDGLNDDPADISDMGPGSLTGLTDCATGEPVCFDGSDWVPPDGWGGDDYLPTIPVVDKVINCGQFFESGELVNEHLWDSSDNHVYTVGCIESTPGAVAVGTCYVFGFPCQHTYPNILKTYFSEEPPLDEDAVWPEDGCVNLAVKNGSIVGSKYDPENDGSYSKPMSEIELCDDFGNSFYLRPSAGGGWKSISDLTTGPDGHLYDSTGQQIRRISHDEFTDSTV